MQLIHLKVKKTKVLDHQPSFREHFWRDASWSPSDDSFLDETESVESLNQKPDTKIEKNKKLFKSQVTQITQVAM